MPQRSDEDILTLQSGIELDPIFFNDDVLRGASLWKKQKEIMASVARHKKTTVKAGHAVGKTFTIARIGLWWMASAENSILITTAPSGRQVKTLLWGEMRSAYFSSHSPLGGQMDLQQWKLSDSWYALGFSTDKPVNVGGFHGKRVMVIVDEASGMNDEIMDGFDSAVAGDQCRLIYTGNPLRPSGRFYESFKDPSFNKISISCLDHPNVIQKKEIYPGMVSWDWCKDRADRWGKKSALYKARVLGQFPEGGTDLLIELEWVDEAKARKIVPHGTIEAGLDVSDGGTDETVFVVRQGAKVKYIEAWNPGKEQTMETVGRVVRLIKKWKVNTIKIDKIGVGAGVHTRIKELKPCPKVIGVNVGEGAYDTEAYQTRRDEIWYGLAQRFADGDIDLTEVTNDEEAWSQITDIKRKHNSRGQQKVESKDEMKRRQVGSPDRGDALCLAFAQVKGPPIITSVHTT